MATFLEPHEETVKLYNEAIDRANLGNYINITIIVNDRSKDIFKVKKCSDIENFKTKDDVNVFINEKVLDQLTPEQRLLVVEESLASISFNTEENKLVITPPDFLAHSGIIRKHSFAVIEVLRETIKSIYQKEKDAEDETKAIAEKAKKDKAFKKK